MKREARGAVAEGVVVDEGQVDAARGGVGRMWCDDEQAPEWEAAEVVELCVVLRGEDRVELGELGGGVGGGGVQAGGGDEVVEVDGGEAGEGGVRGVLVEEGGGEVWMGGEEGGEGAVEGGF